MDEKDTKIYWIGFDADGVFLATAQEPVMGWEIAFTPMDGTQKYLDGLLQYVYPKIMPVADAISGIVREGKDILRVLDVFPVDMRFPFTDAFCRYEADAVAGVLDYPALERFSSFVDGRTEILRRNLRKAKPDPESVRLLLQSEHDSLLSLRLASVRLSAMRGSKKGPAIRITSDRRKFSADWEKKWDEIWNHDKCARDSLGALQGCLNLDVQKYGEVTKVFRMLATKITDKREAPFEHLRIQYPGEIPGRESLLADLATILSYYGMDGHPAMWTVSRKKGNKYVLNTCLSLVPLSGERGMGKVVEMDMRPGARASLRTNWEGCRQAATAVMCKRYGLPEDGLAYDGEGRRRAPVGFDRGNRWSA